MHEVSELTFKLTNTNKHSCAFKAYLEDTSDIVFDVEPKRGILEPYGRAGTNFRITFKPVEVFIRYKGMVIIETEQMYWSFQVVGRLPKYNPPNKSKK